MAGSGLFFPVGNAVRSTAGSCVHKMIGTIQLWYDRD